jgi:hypothetical protein
MNRILRATELSAAELVLLDGLCNVGAQATVNTAKNQLRLQREHNLDEPRAAFIADVVAYTHKELALGFQTLGIQHCAVCGRDAGYEPHERGGKNHKKGDPDRKRPKWIRGIDLADRSKTGSVSRATLGCCDDCWEVAKPALLHELSTIRAEFPKSLTGHWRRFIRSCAVTCSCGWEGHRQQCRFSDDFKYIGCPSCYAMNACFKTYVEQDFKVRPRYTLVDVRRLRFGIVDDFGSPSTPLVTKLRFFAECTARLHDVPRSIELEHGRFNWPRWTDADEVERLGAYEKDLAMARADWEALKGEELAALRAGRAA